MIGIKPLISKEINDRERRVKARYFDGIGLGGTFLAYLFNGALANDINDCCAEVYEYIVDNFTPETEIWMFGLSRGAYTVRCVAGMINNCGILNTEGKEPADIKALCKEVYKIYGSPYEDDKPGSIQSKAFRAKASWDVKIPIKFLGLFDTVGSIGIPSLEAGNGPSYPRLYDQIVPKVVDKVYHACSLHDRLSLFQPCLTEIESNSFTNPTITEVWFPGCHYDLGRQRFKFLRQNAKDPLERLLSFMPNMLSSTVEPNQVISDLVLKWMLQAITAEYKSQNVIKDIQKKIVALDSNILSRRNGVGSGDVYDNPLWYAPFGWMVSPMVKIFFPTWIETAKLILAIRDRRIPGGSAIVYPYDKVYSSLHPHSISQLAGIDSKRYMSATCESFKCWRSCFTTGAWFKWP